jgi:nucleotide-binding universal stress UspA family protein
MTRIVLIGADGSSRTTDAIALGALLAPVLEAEAMLVHGPAALHALADKQDVAAIVLGSSRRGPVGRVVAGRVAHRLLSEAPCPIVVAPAGFAARPPLGLAPIGVAFDGSPAASSVLRTAARLARANRDPLVVISVHQRFAFGYQAVTADRAFVSVNQQLRSDLAARLNAEVAELGMGDHATARLLQGDPATVLAEESENLGLLVVDSRRYGPIAAALFGGPACRLLHRSACPVMVVARGADERSR